MVSSTSNDLIGIGFETTQNLQRVLSRELNVTDSFVELPIENFLSTRGEPLQRLKEFSDDRSLRLRGHSLSIASMDPMNVDYLRLLRDLSARFPKVSFSDHLAWTGVQGRNTHTLLPAPLTLAMADHISARIEELQKFLGGTWTFENVAAPVGFKASTMPEHEFLNRVARQGRCQLTLNLNALYDNSVASEFDPETFLAELDWERVNSVSLAVPPSDAAESGRKKSLWSLYAGALKMFYSTPSREVQHLNVILRDSENVEYADLVGARRWAELLFSEVENGSSRSARIVSENRIS